MFNLNNRQNDFASSSILGRTLGSTTTNTGGFPITPVSMGPPPKAPDYTKLTEIGKLDSIHAALDAASKTYDDLYASTRAMGEQSAASAGAIYAGRLQQQGINPVSQGVVAAQAKLPMFKELAKIRGEQAQQKAEGEFKAQSLAAQVATSIANLQLGYSQTMADYTAKQAQLQISNQQTGLESERLKQQNAQFLANLGFEKDKFGQTLGLQKQQLGLDAEKTAAQIAAMKAEALKNRVLTGVDQNPEGRTFKFSAGPDLFQKTIVWGGGLR